jgi:hypothetical protein
MNSKEIKHFIEFELKGRWKNWLPTPVEIKDIDTYFEPFTMEQAKIAARQYKEENGFEPNIGKIARICDRMKQARKSFTTIPVCSVFDDGYRFDIVYRAAGLVELTFEMAEKIKNEITFWLNDSWYTKFHGNFVPFVGDENYKYAVEMSTRNAEKARNAKRNTG